MSNYFLKTEGGDSIRIRNSPASKLVRPRKKGIPDDPAINLFPNRKARPDFSPFPGLKRGPLGFVAVYFNPCGYTKPRENFERFLKRFKWMQDRLLIVELAFGDADFHLTGKAKNILHLRSDTVVWQKEAMINVGTEILRDHGFVNVGWLDGDTVFHRTKSRWFNSVVKALKTSRAVQVFKEVNHNFSDQSINALGAMANHKLTRTPVHKIYKTGLGWAVSGDIWDQCGWYDSGIAGSGDRLLFLASVGADLREIKRSVQFSASPGYLLDFLTWAQRWHGLVENETNFVKAIAESEVHGSHDNRQYYSREIMLRDQGYDPFQHITRDENGLLAWQPSAPDSLKSAMLDYFQSRKEDS